MTDWVTPLVAIVAILFTFAGGYLTYAAARKNTEQAAVAARRATDESRMVRLELRVDTLELKVGIRDDYVNVLREHINDRKPPPSPPYPQGYWEADR